MAFYSTDCRQFPTTPLAGRLSEPAPIIAGCYDDAQMADENKPQRRKRYRHWSLFHEPSISYDKLGKRAKAGLCIGCGKDPCECKNPRRKRR